MVSLLTLPFAALWLAGTGPGADPAFLRAFAETRGFVLGRPVGVLPTPDGKAVLFLRSPARQPTLSLYEYTVASGQTRELVTPAQLLSGKEEQLSTAEKARRERMRIVDRGLTSFALSEDGRLVMLPLSGRVYLYDRQGAQVGRVRAVGGTGVIDPCLAPDANHLAYVRDQDLYVVDVASGRESRLTRGGTEAVTHGLAEFVAQEEMERLEGYFWSPDSRQLAYTEVDQRGVERLTIADPAHPELKPTPFAYPRAGRANALVRLGIVPVAGGRTVWVRWDAQRYPYLGRVIWKEKKAPLTLLVQTRDQRERALLAVETTTGATRVLHVEKDGAWVELDRDLPRWLPDGSGFLLATERDGARALELRRFDGTLTRSLLLPGRGFHELVHLDQDGRRAVVVTATSTETAVLEVPLGSRSAKKAGSPAEPIAGGAEPSEGSAPTAGEARALTADHALHAPVLSKDGTVAVDSRTAADAWPESAVLRRGPDGWRRIGVLPSVAETPPFPVRLELTTVAAGGRRYAVSLVRPRAWQRGQRLPVIVNVYGGPTSLMVHADQRQYLMAQWIADRGAVVVSIDNRGTPRRDRAWSRAIKGSFGRIPLDDQVEALRALGAKLPELDLTRVGIYGWSFGGYLAALAVLRRPDVFRVAVAGAPVVDWRDYDTHYTERYLDLPEANPTGYQESSLLTWAKGLERPLLIVHGTGDDNVYFFHSLKLADALFRAGRPFDFLPLSVTHQLAEASVRERLWARVADFLLSHLRSD
jgi:dipeptidyl-peptidase-4